MLEAIADSIGADRAPAVPTNITDLDAPATLLERAIAWYADWATNAGYLLLWAKCLRKPLSEGIGRYHKRDYLKHTAQSGSKTGRPPCCTALGNSLTSPRPPAHWQCFLKDAILSTFAGLW
jgi:hypothetical protein